jgi:hypothetical protein
VDKPWQQRVNECSSDVNVVIFIFINETSKNKSETTKLYANTSPTAKGGRNFLLNLNMGKIFSDALHHFLI